MKVEELKHKGVIYPALQAPGGFVSQLFLVSKKDGGYCLVINLKSIEQIQQHSGGTLQDGKLSRGERIGKIPGLASESGFEGHILPNSNSPGPSQNTSSFNGSGRHTNFAAFHLVCLVLQEYS